VSYVAMTAALPLSDLLFSSTVIMGSAASSFSGWSFGALCLVVVGLVAYRSVEEGVKASDPEPPSPVFRGDTEVSLKHPGGTGHDSLDAGFLLGFSTRVEEGNQPLA